MGGHHCQKKESYSGLGGGGWTRKGESPAKTCAAGHLFRFLLEAKLRALGTASCGLCRRRQEGDA